MSSKFKRRKHSHGLSFQDENLSSDSAAENRKSSKFGSSAHVTNPDVIDAGSGGSEEDAARSGRNTRAVPSNGNIYQNASSQTDEPPRRKRGRPRKSDVRPDDDTKTKIRTKSPTLKERPIRSRTSARLLEGARPNGDIYIKEEEPMTKTLSHRHKSESVGRPQFENKVPKSTSDQRQYWPSGKPKGRPRKSDSVPKNRSAESENKLNGDEEPLKAIERKRKRGRPPKIRPDNPLTVQDTSMTDTSAKSLLKKIKLRFDSTLAPQLLTHPLHLAGVAKHASLQDYLNSYLSLDDDIPLREAEERRRRNRQVQKQIAAFRLSKGPNHHGTSKVEIRSHEPIMVVDYRANLNKQGCYFSRLMQDERRRNYSNARRIATMVQAHFKRLAGAKERVHMDHERMLRQLARRLANDVRRKWRLAGKEVHRRNTIRLQAQQREAGKEQLNNILEQSDSLLKAHMANIGDSSSIADSNSDTSDGVEDHYLSVEELRTKYAAVINRKEPEHESSGVSVGHSEDDSYSTAASSGEDILSQSEPPGTLARSHDQLEEDSQASFDSGEDSVMDSELDTSDSEAESVERDGPGLAALYPELAVKDSGIRSATGIDAAEDEDYTTESLEPSGASDDHSNNLETNDNANTISDRKHNISPKPSSIDDDDDSDDSPMDSELDSLATESSGEGDEGPGLSWLYTTAMPEIPKTDNLPKQSTQEPTAVVHSGLDEAEDISPAYRKTLIPPLLRGTLREYQHMGLNWMAELYHNGTNGILADEMGLGKTIQTISLLAWLACERQVWGTHLIVVPTSVMLNWETEFKKFAPGLKVLTYYGTPKERKEKRKGWSKANWFHVVVTSYQLVIHDSQAFRRKQWEYMILDEAHNIKNFKSQRWQTLLNFNTKHRLLLTGTPLQNNLNELWSLLYFLMPQGSAGSASFANLSDFQEWFAKPVDRMIEDSNQAMSDDARRTVSKLHRILRPFILRRLKADVEKQMPGKYEHVIECRLSKRQRFLYDDFMSRSNTRAVLSSGNFLSILNCFMQLRKVCNHPDLFESRPIVTSLALRRSVISEYQAAHSFPYRLYSKSGVIAKTPEILSLIHVSPLALHQRIRTLLWTRTEEAQIESTDDASEVAIMARHLNQLASDRRQSSRNQQDSARKRYYLGTPVYDARTINLIGKLRDPQLIQPTTISGLPRLAPTIAEALAIWQPRIEHFACLTPKVIVLDLPRFTLPLTSTILDRFRNLDDCGFFVRTATAIAFPDKRLLQYDCGKLQQLDNLLRNLISEGHRVLIFTQMTKMLDILEQFLNIHGHRYFRLDGATKIEARQSLTERFNSDSRIPVFILSTRSGGLGINLTGADSVIFYDSDWNPCMDRQCQDRAHRIGQTRDVHIYRFVSEHTIEQNIMRKANQKRMLDNVVIGEGEFTTDFFNKVDWKDMLGDEMAASIKDTETVDVQQALAAVEDIDDARAAQEAQREMDVDANEFAETAGQSDSQVAPASETAAQEPDIGSIDDYMVMFLEREALG